MQYIEIDEKLKKVLFIAYLFPPISNSGTQRSLKFANNLPEFGWEPIVVTLDHSGSKYMQSELMEEVRDTTKIERVPLWGDWAARKIASLFAFVFNQERLTKGLSWRIRGIWRIPDEVAFWRPLVVRRAIQIYDEQGFDAIYATGYPWTSFLIAREISIRTGRPYVLDYRDLWGSFNPGWEKDNKLSGWLENILQRKVIRDAAGVISVTKMLCDYLKTEYADIYKGDVHLITNGFENEEIASVAPHVFDVSDSMINIVYTGVWRPGYSLEEMYCALKRLKNELPGLQDKVRLTVAGFPAGEHLEPELEGIVFELGLLGHREALSLMKGADLVFLSVPEGWYSLASLPGKLFEYMGSGTPILASVPGESEVATVLNEVGGAVCVEKGDTGQLAEAVKTIILSGTGTIPKQNSLALAKYERKNQAKALSEVLSSAIK